jgi:hypothetical protein
MSSVTGITQRDLERWQRWPVLLKRCQVLLVARRLGLGQKHVQHWMAHEAERLIPGGQKTWKYPRETTLNALLDMAGLMAQASVKQAVGAVLPKLPEGVPGSKTTDSEAA